MQPVIKFDAIHTRQLIIENEQTGLDFGCRMQRSLTIWHQDGEVRGFLYNRLNEYFADILIILYYKHSFYNGSFPYRCYISCIFCCLLSTSDHILLQL